MDLHRTTAVPEARGLSPYGRVHCASEQMIVQRAGSHRSKDGAPCSKCPSHGGDGDGAAMLHEDLINLDARFDADAE
jgi:hypothetical protein